MVKPLEAHAEAAKRMLAQECASGGTTELRAAAAVRVYETLFRALAPVIGAAGVWALFARSVRLASADFPCLKEIPMTAAPSESDVQGAQHLASCFRKLEPAAVAEGATAVYAAFLGLLAKLIGERLVMQVVKTAFPAMVEAGTGSKEME